MYMCIECGALFEEPLKGFEGDGDRCPNCHSGWFAEAKKCEACGEMMLPHKGSLCDNCKREIGKALDMFVDMYAETLKVPRDFIKEAVEEWIW